MFREDNLILKTTVLNKNKLKGEGEYMNKPNKLNRFMYALMDEACKDSFMDFLESWDISYEEYEEIEKWFKEKLNIIL